MKTFKLDNEPKIKPGFKIPEDYFENFSSKLTQSLPKEEIQKEAKVISVFRKRETILLAIAAVLVFGLMISILYTTATKNSELDSTTIENYLTEESNINQYDLISEIELENSNIINSKEIEDLALEDVLVTNPNIENLVIENQNKNIK